MNRKPAITGDSAFKSRLTVSPRPLRRQLLPRPKSKLSLKLI
jgi:hypothetical protein